MIWIHTHEPRLVWPYGPRLDRRPEPDPHDPTGYAAGAVAQALDLGFILHAYFDDAHGPRFACSYAILTSPDGATFVTIGFGKARGLRQTITWIRTESADNKHVWLTSDSASGILPDPLDRVQSRFVKVTSFGELLARHQQWIARELHTEPYRLTPGTLLRELEAKTRKDIDARIRAGYIRFIDPASTRFVHTLRGGIKVTRQTFRRIRESAKANRKAVQGTATRRGP